MARCFCRAASPTLMVGGIALRNFGPFVYFIPDAVKPIHLWVGCKAPLVLNIFGQLSSLPSKIADELLDLA